MLLKRYPGERFTRYALLGDDIVIADNRVAHVYTQFLDELGVTISFSKSLVSKIGEFAKRFRVNRLTKDLKPISAAKILSSGITFVVRSRSPL